MTTKIPIVSKHAARVIVKFDCPDCNFKMITDSVSVPHFSEIQNNPTLIRKNDVYENCLNCGKTYKFTATLSQTDRYVEIYPLENKNNAILDEFYDNDEYLDNLIDSMFFDSDFMQVFRNEIQNLKVLLSINIDEHGTQNTLLRQIYSGSITCLETYLSNRLMYKVLNDKNSFKNFLIHDTELSKQNFKIHELYGEDIIEHKVKERLISIMYHNLPAINYLYKKIFMCNLPDFDEIFRIITNRHHMVHRNGRDKDGNEVYIDKISVNNVLHKIESFVSELDWNITISEH